MKKLILNIKSIFRLEDTPKRIAKGFALGSFIGMLPIPGLQLLVAAGLSTILKINRKAACVAVFNTNVATGAFVFAFNYWLGKELLGISPSFSMPDKIGIDFISTILEAGSEVFFAMVLGGVITGVIAAGAAYYIVKAIFTYRATKSTI